MSYCTIKENDKWCVYKQDSEGNPVGEIIGTHDTRNKADDHIQALIASVDDAVVAEGVSDVNAKKKNKVCEDDGKSIDATAGDEGDELIAFGEGVKAIGMVAKDGKTFGRIGGHLILFGDSDKTDLVGDFFTPDTYYGPRDGDGSDVLIHHGRPLKTTGDPKIDAQLKEYSDYLIQPMETKRDAEGIWAETMLDLSKSYERMIYELVKKGVFKWSSGTASHMVRREEGKITGRIMRWPIVEGSLTPTPAEPRMLGTRIMPLKSLDEVTTDFASGLQIDVSRDNVEQKDTKGYVDNSNPDKEEGIAEDNLTILEAVQKAVPDLQEDQVKALDAIFNLAGLSNVDEVVDVVEEEPVKAKAVVPTKKDDPKKDDESTDDDPQDDPNADDSAVDGSNIKPEEWKEGEQERDADFLLKKADTGKDEPAKEEVDTSDSEEEDTKQKGSKSIMEITKEQAAEMLKAIGVTVTDSGIESNRPPYEFKDKGIGDSPDEVAKADAAKSFNAAYVMRYGDEGDAEKAVMTDVFGGGYRQLIFDQNRAFAKYLRIGAEGLEPNEVKALKTQIFPAEGIVRMVKDGFDTSAIKDTMVEAQATLGGYAVPANIQGNIITRLPGLTAVRGSGATVITLTNSNLIEIPMYTGGNSQYAGAERGAWGSETQSPSDKNATLGMIDIRADVYTYKIPMSQSLIEDASNLVSMIQNNIANTLAMDEDVAFLTGDGVGKPLGILPGQANTLGISEVKSGAASSLAVTSVRALKRGLLTQYRQNGVFIANSSTMSSVEQLMFTGGGPWAYPGVDTLEGRRTFESETMPDIAASSYPMLYADMSGYYIVERLGLTIVRFQDSATGINKVEYHVRRRVGGRVAEPWKFAVMKVAA